MQSLVLWQCRYKYTELLVTTVTLTAPPLTPPLGSTYPQTTSQSNMSLWDAAGQWALCTLACMSVNSLMSTRTQVCIYVPLSVCIVLPIMYMHILPLQRSSYLSLKSVLHRLHTLGQLATNQCVQLAVGQLSVSVPCQQEYVSSCIRASLACELGPL